MASTPGAAPTSYDLYNAQVRETVALMAKSGNAPPQAFGIEEERAHPEKYRLPCWVDTSGWDGVRDDTVTSKDGSVFPVRVYTPDSTKHGAGPFPVHINYHGGGFVLGDLGEEASLCAKMAQGAGLVVVDVNYRHCPEAAFGKCFEDAWAAYLWTRQEAERLNAKPDSVSVGGISAGGNIALVVQHLARDNGTPLRLCLVTVPVTSGVMSYTNYTDSPFASFRDFHADAFLSWRDMQWFAKYARRDADDGLPPWYFDLLSAPNLQGLGSTYIRTAEADILRDEGEAYGQRLVAAGNDVRFKRYLGVPHLFPYFEHLDANAAYVEDSVQALKAAHA